MEGIAVSSEGAHELREDPEKADAFVLAAGSFPVFLRYWRFLDQETHTVRSLGRELWPGQQRAIRTMTVEPRIYALKARKLGLTTLEVAFDAWVARFRDDHARVHLFSRRDEAAKELLAAVKFGLDHLPPWMRLPYGEQNDHTLELVASSDDKRVLKAYPASPNTAVEATCNHAHIDEWWRMPFPGKTWQAIEPSFAGSAHILTTGLGPQGYCADFWRRSLARDNEFYPLFISALNRPGRDDAWWKARLRAFGETETRREYPLTWEDALFGGGDFVFAGDDLDFATEDPAGPRGPATGRRYVTGWDIGRHQDAAVGITLDATDEVADVVHYERLREHPYPVIQERVKYLHDLYGRATSVEANNAGEAVVENIDVREGEIHKFNTTAKSKARIIAQLQLAFQNQLITYDKRAWPQLDSELRGYQWADSALVQDSVMALAIAYDYVSEALKAREPARVPRILKW